MPNISLQIHVKFKYFPLFLDMVIQDNEFTTKENKSYAKDKIETHYSETPQRSSSSGLEKSPVQCSGTKFIHFHAGQVTLEAYLPNGQGSRQIIVRTKSLLGTSKKWPWASKMWELLAHRTSFLRVLILQPVCR